MSSYNNPGTVSAEKNVDQCIHIGTGLDRNYLRPFHALIASLAQNHPHCTIKIHAITEGISADEKARLARLVGTYGHHISFYEVDKLLVNRLVLSSQWTSVVYYRLFFSTLLPDTVKRLIYLDCDTLVVNSLESLYKTELDGCPVAAVYDNYVRTQPHIGIVEEGEYFNSGVLLIDMDQWRRQQVSERALEFLEAHPEKILFVDQCALNAVLRNNWKQLKPRFNLMYSVLPANMTKQIMQEFLRDAVVIHFTLQRPWLMLCKNRYRNQYFYYLGRSGIRRRNGLSRYDDFGIGKIPAWLMIRLRELYCDRPFIQRMWRSLRIK